MHPKGIYIMKMTRHQEGGVPSTVPGTQKDSYQLSSQCLCTHGGVAIVEAVRIMED